MPTGANDIHELYVPQFEQFGLRLRDTGPVWTGEVHNALGSGSAWVVPVSKSCLVIDHCITPAHDMLLAEYTPQPYACVTEVSEATLDCMPEVGIAANRIAQPKGPWPLGQVCTFLQDDVGCEKSPLKGGHMYHSRSIMFFDDYFKELEASYPHEFSGMFGDFNRAWSAEASSVMCTALRHLGFSRPGRPGLHLYVRSLVENMVAELAASRSADAQALDAAESSESRRLAEEAAALVEHLLDDGARIDLNGLAARLYVSRSKLCAVFKQETGEALGAYVRRRRCERAEDLLKQTKLSVAEVAKRLGYPQQAAFAQAFKQQTGQTPTAWRNNN